MTLLVDTYPFPTLFEHITVLGNVGVVTIIFLSLRASMFQMLIRKEDLKEG